MASLGLVSPGATTQGVTPIFAEITDDFFSHHRVSLLQIVTPIYFLLENWRPFLLITVTFITFIWVSPPRGCHPAPFYLSDLVCAVFSKFSHNFVLRVSPLEGCHPGQSPSDATGHFGSRRVFPVMRPNLQQPRKITSIYNPRTD